MANAKVCDRCKKVIGEGRSRITLNPIGHSLCLTKFRTVLGYEGVFKWSELDLCESCTDEFESFMKMEDSDES